MEGIAVTDVAVRGTRVDSIRSVVVRDVAARVDSVNGVVVRGIETRDVVLKCVQMRRVAVRVVKTTEKC